MMKGQRSYVSGTLLNRKALPVAPVNRVEMSSARLVRMVSQLAQEKRRVPPMWSKKILPIVHSPAGEKTNTDTESSLIRSLTIM